MVREGNPNVCGEFDFGTHLFLHSFINWLYIIEHSVSDTVLSTENKEVQCLPSEKGTLMICKRE
jgi:hypothetical protein